SSELSGDFVVVKKYWDKEEENSRNGNTTSDSPRLSAKTQQSNIGTNAPPHDHSSKSDQHRGSITPRNATSDQLEDLTTSWTDALLPQPWSGANDPELHDANVNLNTNTRISTSAFVNVNVNANANADTPFSIDDSESVMQLYESKDAYLSPMEMESNEKELDEKSSYNDNSETGSKLTQASSAVFAKHHDNSHKHWISSKSTVNPALTAFARPFLPPIQESITSQVSKHNEHEVDNEIEEKDFVLFSPSAPRSLMFFSDNATEEMTDETRMVEQRTKSDELFHGNIDDTEEMASAPLSHTNHTSVMPLSTSRSTVSVSPFFFSARSMPWSSSSASPSPSPSRPTTISSPPHDINNRQLINSTDVATTTTTTTATTITTTTTTTMTTMTRSFFFPPSSSSSSSSSSTRPHTQTRHDFVGVGHEKTHPTEIRKERHSMDSPFFKDRGSQSRSVSPSQSHSPSHSQSQSHSPPPLLFHHDFPQSFFHSRPENEIRPPAKTNTTRSSSAFRIAFDAGPKTRRADGRAGLTLANSNSSSSMITQHKKTTFKRSKPKEHKSKTHVLTAIASQPTRGALSCNALRIKTENKFENLPRIEIDLIPSTSEVETDQDVLCTVDDDVRSPLLPLLPLLPPVSSPLLPLVSSPKKKKVKAKTKTTPTKKHFPHQIRMHSVDLSHHDIPSHKHSPYRAHHLSNTLVENDFVQLEPSANGLHLQLLPTVQSPHERDYGTTLKEGRRSPRTQTSSTCLLRSATYSQRQERVKSHFGNDTHFGHDSDHSPVEQSIDMSTTLHWRKSAAQPQTATKHSQDSAHAILKSKSVPSLPLAPKLDQRPQETPGNEAKSDHVPQRTRNENDSRDLSVLSSSTVLGQEATKTGDAGRLNVPTHSLLDSSLQRNNNNESNAITFSQTSQSQSFQSGHLANLFGISSSSLSHSSLVMSGYAFSDPLSSTRSLSFTTTIATPNHVPESANPNTTKHAAETAHSDCQ
ncbi:hypothetical protein RFI_19094, partial [Reticulomyxa filosa]